MKIGFATDTNILRKNKLSECQKILDATDIYTEYIETLNKVKSKHELVYYMPEIVVDELLMQKEFSFNQSYKFFEDRYRENSYALLGELPKNNIKEILAQEKEEGNFNIYCSFRTLKYNTDIEISDRKYIIGNIKFTVKGKKEEYAYINSEVSKVDFDLGVTDLLRGFTIGLGNVAKEMSKIIKENVINMESFNALKVVQDAIEKQNKEREAMLQAINNPLKDLKLPTAIDILKENNKL